MESEKTSVALSHVLTTLAFCFEPIILVLWVFKALFRLLTWPLRTPWHVVMWCLDATIMLAVEYKASTPSQSQILNTCNQHKC